MQDDIAASFAWTEEDYAAFLRAVGMLGDRGYDSCIMRAGLFLIGHIAVVSGSLVFLIAMFGAKGEKGPIPPIAVATSLAFASFGAYLLYTRWYGRRRTMSRAFHASELYGLKIAYRFGPTGIETTSRLIQSKRVWSAISGVAEYRDSFLLVSGGAAEWLPKHAFAEPFDDARFTELAKVAVKEFKFIDRTTFPRRRSK